MCTIRYLTSLTLAGDNRELLLSGLVKVDANVVCSYCKRPMSKQPKEFSTLAHIGENAYKQKETRCICCYAFSVNNPAIMGVEKAVAPNTAQRFGMMVGSGALIEVNRDWTWFLVL